MLTVERSKRQIEAITISADFSDRMAAGDSIFDVTITMEVFSGEDSSPEDMLYLPPIIDTQIVSQRVKAGVVGVVYDVQFSVITTDGLILAQTTRLAILPTAPGAVPEYISLYFTSWPYPVDVVDSAQFDMNVLDSRLRPQVFFIPEGVRAYLGFLPGTLIGAKQTYAMQPEWVALSFGAMSGTLETTLVVYSNYTDGSQFYLGPMSANLYDHLVTYFMVPEGVQVTLSGMGGTLA